MATLASPATSVIGPSPALLLPQLRASYVRVMETTLQRIRQAGLLKEASVLEELARRWRAAAERELVAMATAASRGGGGGGTAERPPVARAASGGGRAQQGETAGRAPGRQYTQCRPLTEEELAGAAWRRAGGAAGAAGRGAPARREARPAAAAGPGGGAGPGAGAEGAALVGKRQRPAGGSSTFPAGPAAGPAASTAARGPAASSTAVRQRAGEASLAPRRAAEGSSDAGPESSEGEEDYEGCFEGAKVVVSTAAAVKVEAGGGGGVKEEAVVKRQKLEPEEKRVVVKTEPGVAAAKREGAKAEAEAANSDSDEYDGCFEGCQVIVAAGAQLPAPVKVKEEAAGIVVRPPESSDGSELGSDLDGSEPGDGEADSGLAADIASIRRSRRRWVLRLKRGVLLVSGVESFFSSATGYFDVRVPVGDNAAAAALAVAAVEDQMPLAALLDMR